MFFFNVSHENNFPWSVFNQRKSGAFLNLQNLKGPERFAVIHDLTHFMLQIVAEPPNQVFII